MAPALFAARRHGQALLQPAQISGGFPGRRGAGSHAEAAQTCAGIRRADDLLNGPRESLPHARGHARPAREAGEPPYLQRPGDRAASRWAHADRGEKAETTLITAGRAQRHRMPCAMPCEARCWLLRTSGSQRGDRPIGSQGIAARHRGRKRGYPGAAVSPRSSCMPEGRSRASQRSGGKGGSPVQPATNHLVAPTGVGMGRGTAMDGAGRSTSE